LIDNDDVTLMNVIIVFDFSIYLFWVIFSLKIKYLIKILLLLLLFFI